MQKVRTVETIEIYTSCDFCDNKAQWRKCFICDKDMCEDHMKEFDIIDYDLVYICPECENKNFTELKKLNDNYMQLCASGTDILQKIQIEIDSLNEKKN